MSQTNRQKAETSLKKSIQCAMICSDGSGIPVKKHVVGCPMGPVIHWHCGRMVCPDCPSQQGWEKKFDETFSVIRLIDKRKRNVFNVSDANGKPLGLDIQTNCNEYIKDFIRELLESR